MKLTLEQAFVVFTITLRECWKANAEIARERVNATGTFLISERVYSRRSSLSNSMPGPRGSSSEHHVAVDVLTTTRLAHVVQDEDSKVVPRATPPLSQWA